MLEFNLLASSTKQERREKKKANRQKMIISGRLSAD
jgi:hypothetical protein